MLLYIMGGLCKVLEEGVLSTGLTRLISVMGSFQLKPAKSIVESREFMISLYLCCFPFCSMKVFIITTHLQNIFKGAADLKQ